MQAIWSVVAFVIGIVATYLLILPRLRHCELGIAAERSRADDSDKARQKLEIEVSVLRETAGRIAGLTSELGTANSSIIELTQSHSTVAAGLKAQEEKVSELKHQLAVADQALWRARSFVPLDELV